MQAAQKSVMSQLGALTPQQRQDYQHLVNQGIDPKVARAIVQGYADVRKAGQFNDAEHPRADNGQFSESDGDFDPAGSGLMPEYDPAGLKDKRFKLNDKQASALAAYTNLSTAVSVNYKKMSAAVAGQLPGPQTDDDRRNIEAAAQLNSAIRKQSSDSAVTLYRGTSLPKNIKVGQTLKTARFTSASSDREVAEDFARQSDDKGIKTVLRIHAPKGSQVLKVNHHIEAEMQEEDEHIFSSRQPFVVTHIHPISPGSLIRVVDVTAPPRGKTAKAAPSVARRLVQKGQSRLADDLGMEVSDQATLPSDIERAERPGYHEAYAQAAKDHLPDWQHQQIHRVARASAGGHATAVARQAPDPKTAALAEIDLLNRRISCLQSEVAKQSLLASEAHVPAPDKRLVIKSELERAYIDAALGLVAKADFDESQHPRAANGEFGAGGGASPHGGHGANDDVPFADPKDVKEIKPRKPRQKPVPFADPADVKEVKVPRAPKSKPTQPQVPKTQLLGTTSSGKKVYAGVKANSEHTSDFSPQDHADAAVLHHGALKQPLHVAAQGGPQPVSEKQTSDAWRSHANAYQRAQTTARNAESDASATQSRLGTTASGKSIYRDDAASHRRYKGYSKADHAEAADAHIKEAEAASAKGDSYWVSRHISMAKGHLSQARKPVAKSDASALAYAQAAYDMQAPAEAYAPDADKVPAQAIGLMQANRLVAGMDAEMASGAASPDDARRRASRALVERPGLYDGIGTTPRTDKLDGLQLDLGAGTARAPGHIGLDLGTFGDYGNAIHDLNLGLSEFPDGSVKAVRLVNSLHDILGDDGDPVALLLEIQRVMCDGGQLTYVGPEPLYEDEASWPCPALLLVGEQGTPASVGEDGVGAVRQVFERVPPRVPAYHGADADYQAAGPMPIDVAMAMAAYNDAPARMAMANLVHKTANRVVRIAKAEAQKQVLIGVVLAPNEPDLQGDVMHPDDIEAAAHGYLGTSRVIGSEHGAPIEAHPVESYIAPQDLTFDGPAGRTHVAKGSWVLGVKVVSPDEWSKVMQDGYTGFSVGGFGLREDL
jgi:hypothetical protein